MKKVPEIVLNYPLVWINEYNDVKLMYNNLIKVIGEMDINLRINNDFKRKIKTNGIQLSCHTNFTDDNIWNLKKNYILGYFYFDKSGYSGWADIANKDYSSKINEVNDEDVKSFFNEFSSNYIGNNISKYKQNNKEFKCDSKYVFVATQLLTDTVGKLAYINTVDLVKHVVEMYKGSDTKVVVKIHPKETNKSLYDFLKNHDHAIVSDSSIHSIVPNCEKVYVVNSGVGFESLLHLKPVITTGKNDYSYVTHEVKTKEDLFKTISLSNKVDELSIKKYMYYMLKEYFVKVDCLDSIRKKLNTVVDEYKS